MRVTAWTSGLRANMAACSGASNGGVVSPSTTRPSKSIISNCFGFTSARLTRGVKTKRFEPGIRALTWPKPRTSSSRERMRDASIKVQAVMDRWYSPQGSYYRVSGDDGNVYILKGPAGEELWELVSFTH